MLFHLVVIVSFLFQSHFGSKLNDNITLDDITGDHITIHMVSHTHDDPGWLITVDQYYIQMVQWIFYTMIPILKDNPARKFTYVEMAYMHRWWEEIDDKLKQDTIDLVKSGQLQLNLGGWCMNDEANPTAEAVIHQMTDGNQFILQNFGLNGLPSVGWHVDPFGHSWVTGGLWAQNGFDAFAVHRIDYLDLERRKQNKDLEFMWKGSNSLGEDAWIWFHVLDSGYCSPNEIQFWVKPNALGPPGPASAVVNDDPLLPSYPPNVIEVAESFLADSRNRMNWYRHNQLLMPYGCDFVHQNAYQSMIQMDKLIKYVNGNKTYNTTIIWSTLADYVQTVNRLNLTWQLEQPDFFPYRTNIHAPWTGYFTSRPLLKLYTRSRANELRVAEQFYLFAKGMNLKTVDYNMGMFNISFLRDAFDVLQHHDAITGTEKQLVADEYMNQLSNGTQRVGHWDESVVGYFLQKGNNKPPLTRGNDISQLTEKNVVVLVAYNSLAWVITEFLQIPSNRSDLTVYDKNGNVVPSQINPVCDQERNSKYPAKYNLFILAQKMQPLSFETFFIKVNASQAVVGNIYIAESGETLKAGNGYYTITMDGDTNRLSSITNNGIGQSFKIENQFSQYQPNGGKLYDGWQGSDPYDFRPATDNRLLLTQKNNAANLYYSFAFRQELQSNPNPGILVQGHSTYAQGSNYLNAYTATICDVNIENSSFNVQLYRADNYNYQEKPVLDYLVFDNNNPSYSNFVQGQKTGSVKVNPPPSNSYFNVVVKFDGTPFEINTPVVLASIRSTNNCDGSRYAVTIDNVKNSQATFWIQRVDKNATWTGPVYIDYIAYDPNYFQYSPTFIQGSVTITIPAGTTTTKQFNISYAPYDKFGDEYTDFVPNEPVILMGIQQISPKINSNSDVIQFATTTFQSNWTRFMLNVYPYSKPSQIVELQINYIAFERKTLEAPVTNDADIKNVLISGPLMDEVQQTFRDGYSQTFRVFNVDDDDLKYIDNRAHIGGDNGIDQSAELVTRFSTEFDTDYTFYTNQAGLEYIERVYDPHTDERISGNYYPSAGATYLQDPSGVRFSTIINQGHGVGFGGANMNGQYELMLQRRLTQERIDEVLNTTSHTEPQIMIIMDNDENTVNFNRRYYQIQQFQHSFFFGITDSIQSWVNMYNTTWTAMNNALPDEIFLQELRYVYSGNGNNSDILLQLQHMFGKSESNMANNITLNLAQIFKTQVLRITNQTEMNLFGTIPLSKMHRLKWNVKDDDGNMRTIRDEQSENKRRELQKQKDQSSIVNLSPRDIKTFVINAVPI